MKQLAKKFLSKFIVRTLGYATRRMGDLRILTYHSIQEHKDKKSHMSPALFEEHVRYLSEHGYKSLRVSDIASASPIIPDFRPAVVLTFDDGLSNHRTNVCPILKKYKLVGTFFVPTSYVDTKRRIPLSKNMAPYQDEPVLSWDDLRDMVREGFEIGAHSHKHVMVAKQDQAIGEEEITLPKKILEKNLGVEIKSFAYPKGHSDSFSAWTRTLVKKAGYSAACTQVGGGILPGCDLLELPRQGIKTLDSLADLKLKLDGHYDCLRWFRRYA